MVANVETTILVGPKTQVKDHTKTGFKGQRNRTPRTGHFSRFSAHYSGFSGLAEWPLPNEATKAKRPGFLRAFFEQAIKARSDFGRPIASAYGRRSAHGAYPAYVSTRDAPGGQNRSAYISGRRCSIWLRKSTSWRN